MVDSNKENYVRFKLVKSVSWAILFCILAVSSLAAGFLFFLRIGLDGNGFAVFLKQRIEHATSARLSFDAASLEWMDAETARFSVNALIVKSETGIEPAAILSDVVFEFKILPLLRRRLYFNRIDISGVSVDLEQLVREHQQAATPRFYGAFGIFVKELRVDNGKLLIARNGQSKVLLENIKFASQNLSSFGVDSFVLQGAPAEQHDSKFAAKGKIYNSIRSEAHFDIECAAVNAPVSTLNIIAGKMGYSAPLHKGSADFQLAFKGKSTDFNAAGSTELKNVVLNDARIFSDSVPLDKSRLTFKVDGTHKKVTLDCSEIKIPGMSMSMKAEINREESGNVLTVNINRADLDLRKLFPIVPLNLFESQDRDKITAAGLKGRLLITGGAWSGSMDGITGSKLAQGLVYIDAQLDRVAGFIPGFGIPLTEATGRIRLGADEALFKGISFTIGNSPIVLNGWITNLKGAPKSDLFLSMTAQAQDLKPILAGAVVPTAVQAWLNYISDPQGGLTVNLDVKGALSKPTLKGRIVLDDFSCKLPGVPLPLRKTTGSLRFRSLGISATSIKGLVGDSPFEITGELFPDNINLNCELKLGHADIKKSGFLPVQSSVSGTVPIFALIKGQTSKIGFSVKTDLKGSALDYGDWFRKRSGVPMSLEFSGAKTKDGLSIDEAYLLLNETRISAKVDLPDDGRRSVIVNLPPRGVPSSALIPYVNRSLELQSGGRVEGDLSFRTISDRSNDWLLEANLSTYYLSLKLPMFYKKTEGLTAGIKKRGSQTAVLVERAKIGSSLFSGTIMIQGEDRPKLNVNLDFTFLDTTDFTAPDDYVSHVTWRDWIRNNPVIKFIAKSQCSFSVKAAKGKTKRYSFSDYKINMEGAQGLIHAPAWQVNMAAGIVRGSADFDVRYTTVKPIMVTFQADRLKMERLLNSNPNQVRVEGELYADGALEWKLGPSKHNHGMYKTGTSSVRVQDGTIYKFEILSKLFSLINLGSFVRGRLPDVVAGGLPFQKLTWNMEVFDQKWKIKDLKMISDAARIDSTGMYFSGQERVDFRVDISPLVGLDTLITGLFGNLIAKDGKTLTTTFRVRGLYGAPDIRLEPFDNLRPDGMIR